MRIVYNKKVKDKEVIIREDNSFYIVSIFSYSEYGREQNFLKKINTLDEAKELVNSYFGYIV